MILSSGVIESIEPAPADKQPHARVPAGDRKAGSKGQAESEKSAEDIHPDATDPNVNVRLADANVRAARIGQARDDEVPVLMRVTVRVEDEHGSTGTVQFHVPQAAIGDLGQARVRIHVGPA